MPVDEQLMSQNLSSNVPRPSDRILHHDLKSRTLLIAVKGIMKISDFGLSRSVAIPIRMHTREVHS
ncbi:hypothetical protein KIN20_026329 [Parelaphostrongylus tenuis]|uniref:Protein kinase domain-containing protein n=1 Tax=Parelaphostrongylus tenuis TaxID=148309 RepID=A0AAD5N0H7_PARTN|nr:hypothetical protein KIN20_026329 [Parelaphostrongylus tenuis]